MTRQSQIERAVRAAKKAGLEVISVEVTRDGTVRVNTALTKAKVQEPNGWDKTCAAE